MRHDRFESIFDPRPNARRGWGGGGSTSTTNPVTSPAQEHAIETLLPFELGLVGGGTNQLLGTFDPTVQALQRALRLSPEERALPGLTGEVNTNIATDLGGIASGVGSQMQGLEGPTPRSILRPLEESFTGTVLPGISSAAVRAGAPGGSAEQAMTGQAVEQFGRGATTALDTAASSRLQALTQAMMGENQVGETLSRMLLSGPTAAASMGKAGRELDVQSAQVPFSMGERLLSSARGVSVPWAQQGSTTETRQTGQEGQQAMQMAMMVAMIASMFSSGKLKYDIEPLDRDEYDVALTKLLETPVVRYNYKWEKPGSRKHTGPILELSPPDIREDAWRISIPDYIGLQHAGIKGLNRRLKAVEEAMSHA